MPVTRHHPPVRRTVLRLVAAAAAAVTAVTMVGSAPASAERGGGTFTAGSAGIGDPYYPYYGNGGYDVDHYAIDDRYAPDSGLLRGSTTITATATKDLSRFDLDLLLRPTAVTVDGADAYFRTRGVQELVVRPASGIPAGTTFEVEVSYRGRPARIEGPGPIDPWVRSDDGATAIGEPEIAAFWYASNDHPRDKATFDIAVTVPTGRQAISNGSLTSKQRRGDWTTWTWEPVEPMATYLAFVAIGRYEIERGTDAGGRPYLYAFSEQLGDRVSRNAKRSVRQTARITRFEETRFGPYPFDQVGGVVPGGQFYYALENQTRPVHSRLFFTGGVEPFVIAHEQAHQWYGDEVAVHSWRDIWLNEGFATFAEYLFAKKRFDVAPQHSFVQSYKSFGAGNEFWDYKIANPGKHQEFVYPVYARGAMTLQALRNRLGDADFFDLMQRWALKAHNGSIDQFVERAEAYAGHPLRRFFDVWLYTPRKPAMSVANGFGEQASRTPQGRVDQRRVVRVVDRMLATDKALAAARTRTTD